jgi:integrase
VNSEQPTGALVIRKGDDGQPFYEAKWRRAGRQLKRRVGPAWLDADGQSWRPRRGRVPAAWFDEKRATVRMAELIAEHDAAESAVEQRERERKLRGATLRELASEWLEYLEHEKGAKPSTLLDYRYLLMEPGTPHKRGGGRNPGRIMHAFGDVRLRNVTTSQVATFLRGLDRGGMSARSVNKHRQVLAAMFSYACREDTYGLAANPVSATNKRREMPAAVLDFFEPEEIEALARAAAAGAHRDPRRYALDAGELEWRAWEDHQDAELYRVAAYTGMRLGELLALRWEDVDLDGRRVIVHRAVSAGVEGPTKSWQARALPLADAAASALARLADRGDYTERDDYVFCSRRFHGLRHAAGSLVAREAGAHFVQAFLGHSRLSTTERYLHAKSRPQDVETLNRAFAGAVGAAETRAE